MNWHEGPHLERLAECVVALAREAGATDSECTISEGSEFSATVRMGEVEQVKEAGSRGAGVRVLFGQRTGSSYTSDLSGDGLRAMVSQAVGLARITTEDPFAGLPDAADFGTIDHGLDLYHGDVEALDAASKVEMARLAEKAALMLDPRVSNSEGGSFGSYLGASAFANSRGFLGSYRASNCSLSVVPVVKDGGAMERDYWYSTARSASGLEPPELVGRKAAERALRRLNARSLSTRKAPVIFEPRVARSLLSHVFELLHGDSIYRRASIWAGKLGEQVAGSEVTIIDDSTLPGLFGSTPFDDEGLASRRNVLIDRGVLKSYLLNTYTARKLGLRSTGSASRGLTGNAGIGHGNLYLASGALKPEELLRRMGTGLYVTELMGHGFNAVTGDYSRGAAGLWIENGEIAYPVSKVTIAGNLKEMLNQVAAIGDDLEFRGSVAAPTVAIGEMTISGQ
ncbi:MAG: TldD/PmbA family protein [Bryobacterales bacterium]|nr:TldD/PmbA family protein [Bryobacterales bacterium]